MAWRQVDDGRIASNVGAYELQPVGGLQTRFSVRGSIRSRGWRRIVDGPFMSYLNGGPVHRQHAQLAEALRARA
jgi:hypothetical protein